MKYKIEEWKKGYPFSGSGSFYVAFVRSGGWLWKGWQEIGRSSSKEEALAVCREYERPRGGPWLYSADAVLTE